MTDTPFRGTGRTTARALQAISECLLQPGETIHVIDHYHSTGSRNERFYRLLVKMVEQLGLKITVTYKSNCVYLRSNVEFFA